jgi:hypothetical protein
MPLRLTLSLLTLCLLLTPTHAWAQSFQTRLLNALENPASVAAGKYHASEATVTVAKNIDAKVGPNALALNLTADGPGGKGDFTFNGVYPGFAQSISCWIYLPQGHTLKTVGFQVGDAKGESLLSHVDANWQGWKRITIDINDANFKQTYTQNNHDGKIDLPLKSLHVSFFVTKAGPTSVIVDGMEAQYPVSQVINDAPIAVELSSNSDVPLGQPASATLILTNPNSKSAELQLQVALQANPHLTDLDLPEGDLGRDHARLASSVTLVNGEQIGTNTLTDGDVNSNAGTDYSGQKKWDTADQIITLDKTRTITAMQWESGDANWVAKVNVLASMDGKTYNPVDELQNVDFYKKWGKQSFKFNTPFTARYIKLHYHDNGQKANAIRMPSSLMIYDGMADENTDIPVTGQRIALVEKSVQVPALGYQVLTLPLDKPLTTGSYVLVARVVDGKQVTLTGQEIFCEPVAHKPNPDSKFGLNASRWFLASEHAQLGIGWVRFENFKWPMVSGKADSYSFKPGPAPWRLDIDDAMQTYTDAGLSILPMMFLTPEWASDPVDGLKSKMNLSRVPRSPELYAQFAYQTVARYGSKKLESSKLLTDDKVTGKNQIKYFELGNEPDLNPFRGKDLPSWGAWVGTMDQFWEIYKAGAIAVKQADPDAKVASPGFAGMTCETVDSMRSFTYSDGTHPIDYTDMLSVHFYSGRTPPEIATRDSNNASDLSVAFDEHVRRTCEWRDRNRPGIPIWLTETGYDTGGPIGTNERTQSARLPRVVMISLHNGFDKVIVYRESGSTPTQHAAAGVLRNDLTRRPSWYSYANLIRQLDHATPDQQIKLSGDNTWAYTWNRDGKLLLTAWCVTGEGQLGLELGNATVTDAFGKTQQVSSTAGLKLTEFPLYISGFATNSKLDALRDQNKKERQARKLKQEKLAQTHAYLFDFGKNLESESMNIGKMRAYTKVPTDSVYSKELTYGFEDKPGQKDEFTHWLKDPVERNGVDTHNTNFRCDVNPGKYVVSFKARGPGNAAVTFDTGSQKQEFKVDANEPINTTINADQGYLRIISTGRLSYRFLTVIEQP